MRRWQGRPPKAGQLNLEKASHKYLQGDPVVDDS
jgi:hypothetical protein